MRNEKSRQSWHVPLAALIVFAVMSVSASAQAFTAWADGNTIWVTIGAGLEGDRCCRGASIDLPGGGGQCSVSCPANPEITRPFGCNSVGTHTVYGCVLDKNTNYEYVCSQQTVTVTEPPAATCPQSQLITPGTKTLTHKFGDAFGAAVTYPAGQTTDGELPLKILVKNTPPGGAAITLKVADPPDTSAYGAPHQKDDNIDSAGGTINGSKTTTITLPEHGIVDLVLKTSLQKGGDNYVVMASGNPGLTNDPDFVCSPDTKCEQTPVITSWKRFYVEMNEMFRSSQLIQRNVLVGERLVYVNDRGFRAGDRVAVVHAPSLSRAEPGDVNGFYSETFTIAAVRRNNDPAINAAFEIELSAPVTKAYVRENPFGGTPLGDAIANLSRLPRGATSPTFSLNDSYVASALGEAFVEVVKAPTSGVVVPLYTGMTDLNMVWVARKWFAARTGPQVPSNCAFAVAGATRDPLAAPNQLSLGSTIGTYSYVWNENIEDATSGPRSKFPLTSGHNALKTAGEVLVHELAHQWGVNSGQPANECTKKRYADPSKFCQGNGPQNSGQYDDDLVKFHYVGTSPATADSEYMTIRRADEPKPNP